MVTAYNTISTVEKSTFAELNRKVTAAERRATEAEEESSKYGCLTCHSAPRAGFSLCGRTNCQNACLKCMWQAYNTAQPCCAYCKLQYKSTSQTVEQEMVQGGHEVHGGAGI